MKHYNTAAIKEHDHKHTFTPVSTYKKHGEHRLVLGSCEGICV